MEIDYETAKKKKLIQITNWLRKNEITKMFADEFETVAICPNCHTPLKVKKKIDLTTYEWMKIYCNRMNQYINNFYIVKNNNRKDYYAIFANNVSEDSNG